MYIRISNLLLACTPQKLPPPNCENISFSLRPRKLRSTYSKATSQDSISGIRFSNALPITICACRALDSLRTRIAEFRMDHSAVEVTGICLAPSGHALFLPHAFHGIVWPREGSRPTRCNATRPHRFGAQSRMTIAPPPPTRSSRAARSSSGRARGGAGTRANQRAYVVRRVESWSRDWRPPIFRLARGLCRAASFPWVRSGSFLVTFRHPCSPAARCSRCLPFSRCESVRWKGTVREGAFPEERALLRSSWLRFPFPDALHTLRPFPYPFAKRLGILGWPRSAPELSARADSVFIIYPSRAFDTSVLSARDTPSR